MASGTNPPDNNEGYEFDQEPADNGKNGNGSLGSAAPSVAAAPGKMIMIVLAAAAGIGIVLYSLLGSSPEPEKPKDPKPEPVAVESPNTNIPPPFIGNTNPELPKPEIPAVEEPVPPPPPPPPPPPVIPDVTANKPTNEVLQARIKSNMLVMSSGEKVTSNPTRDNAEKALSANDPNTAFANNAIKASAAEKVTAGNVGDLRFMIAQGKVIHAVLETAINSDLPGSIRAIVSRDVFAEAGEGVMIPKGSRLIGVYNPSVLRGQSRVFIVWNRVIRPDGIDIMINSPGIDALGRAGMNGYVDDKVLESYTSAILSSLVTVGVAYGGEKLVGEDKTKTTQTTDPQGNTSTSTPSSPTTTALNQGVANIGSVTTDVMTGLLDLRPTISIDQGSRINVFVNKDLVFPPSVLAQTKILQ